ncbi:hypothetical protein ABEF79_05860 [Acinetobacter sp. ANC 7454]|uniref:hypothetical protein n=1 Tax=Acinetobacter thermotolerans TaxID=3151487 RepID=UPI00325BFB7F
MIEKVGYRLAESAARNYRNSGDIITAGAIEKELLEYRRENGIFEVGDCVFMRDKHYTEMFIVTNILNDGRIEIKTAKYGFPVPSYCWGLYYGNSKGLVHASDAEIKTGERLEGTI